MFFKFILVIFFVAISFLQTVYGAEEIIEPNLYAGINQNQREYNLSTDYYDDDDYDDDDLNDRPYCFRFTWIGSKFGSSKLKNRTCAAIVGKADLVCEEPLFMNVHNNQPNTNALWETFKSNRSHIACRLAPGDVCVKYSYIYNKAVENITYTCTKVNIEDEGPVTSGCYSEYQNGREIEVCVCKSTISNIPCNSGDTIFSQKIEILTLTGLFMLFRQFKF